MFGFAWRGELAVASPLRARQATEYSINLVKAMAIITSRRRNTMVMSLLR